MPDDEYLRITKAQFEIWMNSSVTKSFLLALQWEIDHVKEDLKPVMDPSDANASHAFLFEMQGTTNGFERAKDPLNILKRSGLYEISERANRLRDVSSPRVPTNH